jgi:Flp pilus assembly protein CpaB
LTPTNALIGFAGAGQSVDVLFHYGEQRKVANQDNEASANGAPSSDRAAKLFQSATVTLVQNATILALGNRAAETADANGIQANNRVLVTLAVAPHDAEAIRVADGNGELSLTLRGPDDESDVVLGQPKLLSEIIEVDSGIRTMEIYRGTRVTHHEFDSKGKVSRSAIVHQDVEQRPQNQKSKYSMIGDGQDRQIKGQRANQNQREPVSTVSTETPNTQSERPGSLLNQRRRLSDMTGGSNGTRKQRRR